MNNRLRWIDRCLYRRKYFFRRALLIIGMALALYGLWYSVSVVRYHNQIVENERRKVMIAEQDKADMLLVMEGKRLWIQADGAKFAKVEWIRAKELVR